MDCANESLYIICLAYTRMQFQMFSSFIQASLQFYSRILMICIGFHVLLALFSSINDRICFFYRDLELIGSIQIFRHTNSLLGDMEMLLTWIKVLLGNVCIRSSFFFCFASVSIRLPHAFAGILVWRLDSYIIILYICYGMKQQSGWFQISHCCMCSHWCGSLCPGAIPYQFC